MSIPKLRKIPRAVYMFSLVGAMLYVLPYPDVLTIKGYASDKMSLHGNGKSTPSVKSSSTLKPLPTNDTVASHPANNKIVKQSEESQRGVMGAENMGLKINSTAATINRITLPRNQRPKYAHPNTTQTTPGAFSNTTHTPSKFHITLNFTNVPVVGDTNVVDPFCALKDRAETLADYCKGRTAHIGYMPPIIVDRKRKFLFCYINKVASSSMKQYFSNKNGFKWKSYPRRRLKRAGFEFLYTFKRDANLMKDILGTYKKVILVRHPLDRLRSAYWNKFVRMHYLGDNKVEILRRIFRKDRADNYPHLHFHEFIKSLVLHAIPRGDTHWLTYEKTCNPCAVNYDVILKMESFGRDLSNLDRMLYNQNNPTVKHRNVGIYRGKNNLTIGENENLIDEFAEVDAADYKKLMSIYERDMKMFGYTFDRKRNVGKCGSDCC